MSNHDDLPLPPAAEPTIVHTVEIAYDEFLRLFELRLICADDERKAIGNLRLHTVNGRRCWDATDSIRAARFSPDFDSGDYDLLVPPSMLMFGSTVLGDGITLQLQLAAMPDGSQRIVLVGAGGSTSVEHRNLGFPNLDNITSGSDADVRATLSHKHLINFTHPLHVSRYPLDDDPMVPCLLTLEGDSLRADLDWGDCGVTTLLMPVRGSGGSVSRLVAPALLYSLTLLFEGDDTEIEMVLPAAVAQPLRLSSREMQVWLTPIGHPNEIETLRKGVEAVISEVCGPIGTRRDDDGDYPLYRQGAAVYGRLVNGTPSMFQVFAVVLRDVEPSVELLAELNDLNMTIGFARLFDVDGQVLAEVDLVASTLDPAELATALDRIVGIAERVSPTLEVVFGGNAASNVQEMRWQSYRTMVVDAEVKPGSMTQLNGIGAVEAWPFPGPVYVLTAWNPQGVPLDDAVHHSINHKIAIDILQRGGRFVHGVGRSPNDEHREPSLVAWGITRDEARIMGRRANQDAIAEIDAHEFRLLSCPNDQTEAWGRFE